MALLRPIDFCLFVGVNSSSLYLAIREGRVVQRKDHYIDTTNIDNETYIAKHNEGELKQPEPDQYPGPKRIKKKRKKRTLRKPKETPYRSPYPEDNKPKPNGGEGSRADAEQRKLEAQIEKIEVSTAKTRQELVERSLVRWLFGTLATIDQNEFLPIAANVAPEIAGLCGKEDAKTIVAIEKLLQDKFYGLLKHRQRVIKDFLKRVKAKPLEQSK